MGIYIYIYIYIYTVLCRVTQSSSPSRVPSQMCASPKSSRVFLLMDQVESKSELLLSRVESSRVESKSYCP